MSTNGHNDSERRHRIGYAFPEKKLQSFIQPSLIDHAAHHGIDLVHIDGAKPLSQQGLFDCIIHKLYSHGWNQQLKDYVSIHPQTVILDSPEAIASLHNRVSMLDVVTAAFKAPRSEKVSAPKQILVRDSAKLKDYSSSDLDLTFPVIAKPVLANGSAKSHEMSMVFSPQGLKKLRSPILLQEFVNHGGVLFKVYVIGEYVQCVKRRSLPNVTEEQMATLGEQVLPFSQISNSADDDVDLVDGAEMPPNGLVEELARGIRLGLNLNLFNFDVIRDCKDIHSYYVIDINYFPGYFKLHNFEHLLTDFFLAKVSKKEEDQE